MFPQLAHTRVVHSLGLNRAQRLVIDPLNWLGKSCTMREVERRRRARVDRVVRHLVSQTLELDDQEKLQLGGNGG